MALTRVTFTRGNISRLQHTVLDRIRKYLELLCDTAERLSDLSGFFRDRHKSVIPTDVTLGLRKLAGAFRDLGVDLGVNINQDALELERKLGEVEGRIAKAVVLLKQSCDLNDQQFVRRVMTLLDAAPTEGKKMLAYVLADINHEEKQRLKKVDDVAVLQSSIGSPGSEAFWKNHFGDQSAVPWRIFQDIFIQEQYGDLDHASFSQLNYLLRRHLDAQGTGTVAHQRFIQFLDTQWSAVRTEFRPQRGLKLPERRRSADALPLLVTSVVKPTLYLKEGMSFTVTPQGYPLSMRIHRDGITVFGRKSQRSAGVVDVQLDDPSVSQVHAQVLFRDGRFWLVDLGSTGGTYMWMQRPVLARPGMVFQLAFSDVFVVTEVNGEQLYGLEADLSPEEDPDDVGLWFGRGALEEVEVEFSPQLQVVEENYESSEGEKRAKPPVTDEEVEEIEGEEESEEEKSQQSDSEKSGENEEENSEKSDENEEENSEKGESAKSDSEQIEEENSEKSDKSDEEDEKSEKSDPSESEKHSEIEASEQSEISEHRESHYSKSSKSQSSSQKYPQKAPQPPIKQPTPVRIKPSLLIPKPAFSVPLSPKAEVAKPTALKGGKEQSVSSEVGSEAGKQSGASKQSEKGKEKSVKSESQSEAASVNSQKKSQKSLEKSVSSSRQSESEQSRQESSKKSPSKSMSNSEEKSESEGSVSKLSQKSKEKSVSSQRRSELQSEEKPSAPKAAGKREQTQDSKVSPTGKSVPPKSGNPLPPSPRHLREELKKSLSGPRERSEHGSDLDESQPPPIEEEPNEEEDRSAESEVSEKSESHASKPDQSQSESRPSKSHQSASKPSNSHQSSSDQSHSSDSQSEQSNPEQSQSDPEESKSAQSDHQSSDVSDSQASLSSSQQSSSRSSRSRQPPKPTGKKPPKPNITSESMDGRPVVKPSIQLLCILKGEHLGRKWRFHPDPDGVTIGRGSDCHIRLRDKRVGTRHCRFVLDNGAWVLEGFKAENMVWVHLSDYNTLRRKEPSGAVPLEAGGCFKSGGVDFQVGG